MGGGIIKIPHPTNGVFCQVEIFSAMASVRSVSLRGLIIAPPNCGDGRLVLMAWSDFWPVQ